VRDADLNLMAPDLLLTVRARRSLVGLANDRGGNIMINASSVARQGASS
jgi:hypothetical protein